VSVDVKPELHNVLATLLQLVQIGLKTLKQSIIVTWSQNKSKTLLL